MTETTATLQSSSTHRKPSTTHVVKLLVAVMMPVALLFGVSGHWDWLAGWVYLVLMIGGGTLAIRIMARRHPALLRERSEAWRNGKAWDKPFLLVIGALGPAATQLVSGLDKRFGWSPLPNAWVQVAGALAFVAGTALTAWAIAVNPFFSSIVRVQSDRGHHVIARGPYEYVRHPGYVGMAICAIATPALLGTWWALVPALLVVGFVAGRTALEDATLRAELPGYEEYASRTRSRLLPRVW